MPWLLVPILLVGVTLSFWTIIGGIRLAGGWMRHRGEPSAADDDGGRLAPSDVAVVIPAHNEEPCIGATILSVLHLVPADQVHVIADGCDDNTAAVARSFGVNVLTLNPSRGKAGGIEAALERFDICRRFGVLLIVDADTQLDENYLERGLRMLSDPAHGAVAGYAYAGWRPEELTAAGRFLVSYRARLYVIAQWIRYGQTWRYTNVTHIVPGFASMYRTDILPKMDLNPPGLIIEDFNMTFELRRKRLGKVAFEPRVFGITQDPDTLREYYHQVTRWSLGFWQTLRRHGLWFSWFSGVLSVFVLEVLLGSVILLLSSLALVFLAVDPISGGLAVRWGWYLPEYLVLAPLLSPTNLLFFLFVPDYLLTCAVAIWLRRPSLLVYGLGFLFVRLVDGLIVWMTLPRGWLARSTGRWESPTRRPVDTSAALEVVLASDHARRGDGGLAPEPAPFADQAPATGSSSLAMGRGELPVLRDALMAAIVLTVAAGLVQLGVPVLVVIVAIVLGLGLAVGLGHRGSARITGPGPERRVH